MRTLVKGLLAIGCLGGCASQSATPELQFAIEDGAIRNDFFRDGPVAAHVVLKSATAPRLVVAFPAGNSGVGLWFAERSETALWEAPQKIEAASQALDDGGIRRGVQFETTISAPRLDVSKAILSNVRVLRDYGYTGKTPEIVDAAPRIEKSKVVWERRRLDGAAGYFLSIEALNGSVENAGQTPSLAFVADGGEPLRLRVVALTGDIPLTGIPQSALLTDEAGSDARLRNVLTFLAYEEKLLAGSWQYNTYFGRDTLMSLALLGDALQPAAIEAGLGSVLDRLSATGEVAHEEDISEYALLRRRREGSSESAEPILDYKMIDDDFMLAPVLAEYLLGSPDGGARAKDFLSRSSPSGVLYRDLVRRNLDYVVNAARPYGAKPRWSNLIRLRSDDPPVGEWRDSNAGLGGGMYPYDVNAALVPAALASSSRLAASGLLGDGADVKALADESQRLADIWATSASSHFAVSVDPKAAARKFSAAAARLHLNPETATPPLNGKIAFPALALDGSGVPIRVMHSDVGFAMLFGEPTASELDAAAGLILRPFPEGLTTPAGMVVANAALAPAALAEKFGNDRYHGAVIWSWQQALMKAGLRRQLKRSDLPDPLRSKLSEAAAVLESLTTAGADHKSAELWTWSVEDGAIKRSPFGDSDRDETESNAAQLWSTAHLADNDTVAETAQESAASILDYKMIDDDFMLAPVLARYLLDTPDGAAQARAFLSQTSPSGVLYRDLVRRNIDYVVTAARPYGAKPIWSNLIRLRDPAVGNWRDTNDGLGGGVYPYDVSAALVPAALTAASRLAASGLLGTGDDVRALVDESRRLADIWARAAPSHFNVVVDAKTAARKFSAAAARLHLNPDTAAAPKGPIAFPALALDRTGAPIEVMHSDVGFAMLFGAPQERELEEAAELILRPFPEGLTTPVGMVVANASLAPTALAEKFGEDRYAGAIVSSWQQALMKAGLTKQMERNDLPDPLRAKLGDALRRLGILIDAARAHRTAELWTWTVEDGAIKRSPFGDSPRDETEANAAQLWSTAHLAYRAEEALN